MAEEYLLNALAACIRRERIGLGLSLEDMAAETGFSVERVRRIECLGLDDDLTIETLEPIARVFGITVSALVWAAEQDCPPSRLLRAPPPKYGFAPDLEDPDRAD